jgi:lipoyl synthase
VLRVRWLGTVPYEQAHLLQRALHERTSDQYLLLLEHPHVFTLGVRGDLSHVLVDPSDVGASLLRTDRGGDVTYHGPGQLVAYPILDVPMASGAVPAHVHRVEQVVIDTLGQHGLRAGRLEGYPGVWVDPEGPQPRKICAVGVRVSKGRSMHGLALNVDPDMSWFDRIVPCGISGMAVTSMSREGLSAPIGAVVDTLVNNARRVWAPDGRIERQDVVSSHARSRSAAHVSQGSSYAAADSVPSLRSPESFGHPYGPGGGASRAGGGGERLRLRLRRAGVDPDKGLEVSARKPSWLRVPARMGEDFLSLKRTVRGLGLVTVCEEAGCPNIFECWGQGTATFMINGERCTRACGFCLVDTRHPLAPDPEEPKRVAEAVARLGLKHAVVTAVARDDLADGGASGFAATVATIRNRCPETAVEVLVPDCKGDEASIATIIEMRPDVFNHNIETVARLQRAVRPSAGYARSLAVLAQAKTADLVTKSGLILGMGEEDHEVIGALADLRAVGVDIVTIGQYLRPTAAHLPVARWWTPDEFERLSLVGHEMGFAHVQASPLTRSSYHARDAVSAARGEPQATATVSIP